MFLKDEYYRENIISIIMFATDKKYRVYKDVVNNPDLIISIIDRAFALAKIENSDCVLIKHFVESLSYCDRIYDSIKQSAMDKLSDLTKEEVVKRERKRVINVNFMSDDN